MINTIKLLQVPATDHQGLHRSLESITNKKIVLERKKYKLGLSCAKLRASLDLSDFDKILVYFDLLVWY